MQVISRGWWILAVSFTHRDCSRRWDIMVTRSVWTNGQTNRQTNKRMCAADGQQPENIMPSHTHCLKHYAFTHTIKMPAFITMMDAVTVTTATVRVHPAHLSMQTQRWVAAEPHSPLPYITKIILTLPTTWSLLHPQSQQLHTVS